MSISLIAIAAGLPILLAARTVMGKERFEEWVNSGEYVVETNFKDFDEMEKNVLKAGYDVTSLAGSPKTHLTEKKSSYFLWEMREGKVVAVMSLYDDKQDIQHFINSVERTAGKKIFFPAEETVSEEQYIVASENISDTILMQSTSKVDSAISDPVVLQIIPTIFLDKAILIATLSDLGILVNEEADERILGHWGQYSMTFYRKNAEETFDLQIQCQANELNLFYSSLYALRDEYCTSIQERTYRHVLDKLKEKDFIIEEETVLEDNSVVITVQI